MLLFVHRTCNHPEIAREMPPNSLGGKFQEFPSNSVFPLVAIFSDHWLNQPRLPIAHQ